MGPKNTSFFLQSWRLNLGAERSPYSVNIPGAQALFFEFCEGFVCLVPEGVAAGEEMSKHHHTLNTGGRSVL